MSFRMPRWPGTITAAAMAAPMTAMISPLIGVPPPDPAMCRLVRDAA